MWKMRIGDHLLQDDQSISVDFSPILAAHKIFEKKKTWISSQRRTHEKNHAKKRTPLCQVLIFQLLWWLLVCAQLDIDGICQQWPRCFRSFPQSKAIWRATSGDPRLANHNRERSVTHEMSTSDIYTQATLGAGTFLWTNMSILLSLLQITFLWTKYYPE